MTGPSLFFKPMIRDFALWNRGSLLALSKDELRGMALLLGVSKRGPKEILCTRLLAVKDLRLRLSKVTAPEELVEAYKLKELKGMCATAKIYIGGNKRSAATNLLNWRNKCRHAGQKIINEVRKEKTDGTKRNR